MPQFLTTFWRVASQLIAEHITFISLLALAFIATMREELPAPFNRWSICAWVYGWLHDALKAFINMRNPSSPATAARVPIKPTDMPTSNLPILPPLDLRNGLASPQPDPNSPHA